MMKKMSCLLILTAGILALAACDQKQNAEETSLLNCRQFCNTKGLVMDPQETQSSGQCSCEGSTDNADHD